MSGCCEVFCIAVLSLSTDFCHRTTLVVFKNEERTGCVEFWVWASLLLLLLIPLLIQSGGGIRSGIRSRSKTSARRFEAKLH